MITEIDHWRTADAKGMTMPWFTRACCEWLSTLELENKLVFEYGGGQSSLWFGEQGCIVYGVDHQKEWADLGKIDWETNESSYVRHISTLRPGGKFDIVCIDGEWRDECTEWALAYLSKDGFIIIDNWDQPSVPPNEWSKTLALIEKKGLKTKIFHEKDHPDWQTIIITR